MLPLIYIAIVLIVQLAIPIRCEDPALLTIYDVVPHFKVVHACNRHFTTTYNANKLGVRSITFTGTYKKGETGEALCRCILGYENQINWLQGSTNSCSTDKTKNTATLTLTGKPDPTFKNHKPEDPVQLLKKTFDQFPLAQINLLNCRPKAIEQKNGCVDFKMACNLLPDSLDKQKICDGILDYINQGKWLGKLTSPCTIDGNVLNLDISSDKEPAKCRGRRD